FYVNKKDTLIKIPIRVTGTTADIDRDYKVQIANNSTAEEGNHFDFADQDFVISAGEVTDSLRIILHRTPVLEKDTVFATFELKPNKYFSTKMRDKESSSGEKINFTSFKLYSTDVLKKPQGWSDPYLGTFSAKKFYLIAEVMDV